MPVETKPGTGEKQLLYYLPETKVLVTGKKTTQFLFSKGEEVTTAAGQFSLAVAADLDRYYYLQDCDSLIADKELTVDYYPNGLLKSTDAAFTGKLGSIVQNLFSVASSFLPLIFRGGALLAAARSKKTAEQTYEDEHPNMAEMRTKLRSAIRRSVDAIAAKSESLAAATDPDVISALEGVLGKLHAQLAKLEGLAEKVENHFSTWKASKEKAIEQELSFQLDVESLPVDERVASLVDATQDQVKATIGVAATPIFEQLRLVVARDDGAPKPNEVNPPAGEAAKGLIVRMVRPVRFSLFRIEESGGRFTARFLEASTRSVLDARSPLCFMPIQKGFWSKKSLTLSFAEDGSILKVDASSNSELAGMAESLGKLPADLIQGLKNANAVVDERQKLALQEVEQRIAELEKKKELVESGQLLNESLALGEQSLKIKELEKEIALLEKQRQLAALGSAQTGQIEALGLQQKLLAAETSLERAEVERLKVQAELEKLRQSSAE